MAKLTRAGASGGRHQRGSARTQGVGSTGTPGAGQPVPEALPPGCFPERLGEGHTAAPCCQTRQLTRPGRETRGSAQHRSCRVLSQLTPGFGDAATWAELPARCRGRPPANALLGAALCSQTRQLLPEMLPRPGFTLRTRGSPSLVLLSWR